jgi:hypothetical protein
MALVWIRKFGQIIITLLKAPIRQVPIEVVAIIEDAFLLDQLA